MLTSPVKRYMLPFSTRKNRNPYVEEAAVFALAEMQRNRGGGLLSRQPQEKLSAISKAAYPMWLFPKNNVMLIFDGLNGSSQCITYAEVPSALAFMDNLQLNSRPRGNYAAFLSDNSNYFQQTLKEKHFTLQGLIADPFFKAEFSTYLKEAFELTTTVTAIAPLLEENAIAATLSELEKLQAYLKAEAEKLNESLRFITKTTRQYTTEIDYEAAASKDEVDAKIKALQEFINPQIAKINKEYHHKIKQLTESFDHEIEIKHKQKLKTEKSMPNMEAKINHYEHEAKVQSKKGHDFYERHWKEKVKRTHKELSALKKEHKKIENSIKELAKQKRHAASELNFELDSKIKLARQPILNLEAVRDAKILAYRQESKNLLSLEKPIIEGINVSSRMLENVKAEFKRLGIQSSQIKMPALFYVPFYLVCYEIDLSRRYMCIPPSTVSSVDFSTKLKGTFGMSKIKDLLAPRFPTITALINHVETTANQDSFLEGNLWSLGEKNNLLKNSDFLKEAAEGLLYIQGEGWLSEHELADLRNRLLA